MFSISAAPSPFSFSLGLCLFLSSGYSCEEFGASSRGGDDCFVDGMWILDFATMTWSHIPPPDSSDSNHALWPSRRAYGNAVAHHDRGLIIIQGG